MSDIVLYYTCSYGYTEYSNEAAVKEAVDKYKGSLELRGEKLFVYKCCKDKPSGKCLWL